MPVAAAESTRPPWGDEPLAAAAEEGVAEWEARRLVPAVEPRVAAALSGTNSPMVSPLPPILPLPPPAREAGVVVVDDDDEDEDEEAEAAAVAGRLIGTRTWKVGQVAPPEAPSCGTAARLVRPR